MFSGRALPQSPCYEKQGISGQIDLTGTAEGKHEPAESMQDGIVESSNGREFRKDLSRLLTDEKNLHAKQLT